MFGIPCGSSPINPLSCAPTGLKYLSIAISQVLSDLYKSCKICSINNFVVPYGFVVPPILQSSVKGILSGSPYTVADELNINFFTLYFLIVSNSTIAPDILFS